MSPFLMIMPTPAPYNPPRSTRTLLDTKGKYTLWHGTAGSEIAGSGTRWTNEYWSVEFTFENALHGRRFATEEEARKRFDGHD